jgi:23S rRNA (cytosine1962-C5)-methyltransferase
MKSRDPRETFTAARQTRLRLHVTAAAESAIRSGHPWVFADSIQHQNRDGRLGELGAIYDRRDRFLGIGLFDPGSPLRMRMLHVGKPQAIDHDWWNSRLQSAVARREGLFDAQTNGFRLINGESDGWPGLVLDRYGMAMVLKLYTAAWLPRLDAVVEVIAKALKPDRLVLRLSRNIQTLARTEFNQAEGQELFAGRWNAPPIPAVVEFLETGLRFGADVIKGQKTGFFLDQRENRRRVESLATGRDVLNAFSFSGGFSLYAARGSAKSVTDIDISPHALEAARRNFSLNRGQATIARCRHESIQADVFEWLHQARRNTFDLVVLDPPSLAKREAERAASIRAYTNLVGSGLRLLRRGGHLVAASCSAHVSAEEFFAAVRRAAVAAGRRFTEAGNYGHPPDHPATFAEAQYLKCIYLRVES